MRRLSSLGALLIALAALLVAFAALPLALVLGRSVVGPAGFDAGPLLSAWSEGRTWELLGVSVLVSALAAALAVLLGAPAAWLLARTDVYHPQALRTALALPYVVPPYILAIGWITLLNPRSGLVNVALRTVLGGESGPLDIYSLWGIVLVDGLAYFPLVLMQVHAALAGLDPSLEEAARTSGASPGRVVLTVTLPLLTPAIASSALLVFLICMASFGVPYLVGGPGHVEVLTTAIYAAIDIGTEEATARAVGLALLLGLAAAAALALNGVLVRRGRALVGGKAGRASLVRLGRWRNAATAALWALAAFALALPLCTLVLTSLLGSWGRGFALDNLSLSNYATVFADSRTLHAAWTSLWIGAAAAALCTALGALASYARRRTNAPGRQLLPLLAELPYALPGTVLAMGFILAFSQELWIYRPDTFYIKILIFNTPWILLIAYSVKYMAFGVRSADAALTQIDASLEEAARTSGASRLRVLGDIVAPLMRPALVAAWVLVFLPVLGEITMSILLFGPETRTLGVLLFDYQTYESPPKAAVLGTLLVAAILLGNGLVKRLTGGRLGI